MPPDFEEIINFIKNEMEILCCHDQECTEHKSFSRVVYCIQVSKPLFDLFFNSKNGYRAWYYRNPHLGTMNNELFIKSLSPFLIASIQSKDIDTKRASESLKSYSAKAWLAEIGKEVDKKCLGCAGEWAYPQNDAAEIINERWERETDPKAKCGKKAPYLTKIRIFGAFLNNKYDELIPEAKRFRAQHICHFGWS